MRQILQLFWKWYSSYHLSRNNCSHASCQNVMTKYFRTEIDFMSSVYQLIKISRFKDNDSFYPEIILRKWESNVDWWVVYHFICINNVYVAINYYEWSSQIQR